MCHGDFVNTAYKKSKTIRNHRKATQNFIGKNVLMFDCPICMESGSAAARLSFATRQELARHFSSEHIERFDNSINRNTSYVNDNTISAKQVEPISTYKCMLNEELSHFKDYFLSQGFVPPGCTIEQIQENKRKRDPSLKAYLPPDLILTKKMYREMKLSPEEQRTVDSTTTRHQRKERCEALERIHVQRLLSKQHRNTPCEENVREFADNIRKVRDCLKQTAKDQIRSKLQFYLNSKGVPAVTYAGITEKAKNDPRFCCMIRGILQRDVYPVSTQNPEYSRNTLAEDMLDSCGFFILPKPMLYKTQTTDFCRRFIAEAMNEVVGGSFPKKKNGLQIFTIEQWLSLSKNQRTSVTDVVAQGETNTSQNVGVNRSYDVECVVNETPLAVAFDDEDTACSISRRQLFQTSKTNIGQPKKVNIFILRVTC